MDRGAFFRNFRVLLRLPARADGVPPSASRIRSLNIGGKRLRDLGQNPRNRAIAYAAAALILGTLAYRSSVREARWNWLKTNPASPTVWSRMLEMQGYRRLTDRAAIRKFSPSLPYVAHAAPRAWITENRWIVAFFDEEEPRVYVRGTTPPNVRREEWEPLGWGWEALHRFVLWAEQTPYTNPGMPKKVLRLPQDPRAIQY